MPKRILTLSGGAAVGKSFVIEQLKIQLPDYCYLSVGGIARALAAIHGFAPEQFTYFVNEYARTEEFLSKNNGVSYDDTLDSETKRVINAYHHIIIDSRIGFFFAGDQSFNVALVSPMDVRVSRVIADPRREEFGISASEAEKKLTGRDSADIAAYVQKYGVDPSDPKHYHCIFDTSLPENGKRFITENILKAFELS